jgi:hypothetical protein
MLREKCSEIIGKSRRNTIGISFERDFGLLRNSKLKAPGAQADQVESLVGGSLL